MRTMLGAIALAATATLAMLVPGVRDGAAAEERAPAGARESAGSPTRGRSVYYGNGCDGCHALTRPDGEPSAGGPLTLERLRREAAIAGTPLGPFVAESLLVPNAHVSSGYVGGVMPAYAWLPDRQLDDLVSYLIGAPYSGSSGAAVQVPKRPIARCNADPACRATVRRWTRVARLPARAVPGAKVAASAGCLSCHRFAGSGRQAPGAPDLSRRPAGNVGRAALVRRLRCPRCIRKDATMPSYAALGEDNLRRVAEFLLAAQAAGARKR